MTRVLPLLFFVLVAMVEVIAQTPTSSGFFPHIHDSFKQELTKTATEIPKYGNVENGRDLKSFDSHKFLEDDEFILDSTITYLYESPIDSTPSIKFIPGQNLRFNFDIDTQHWVKSDSFALKLVDRYSEDISYKWDGGSESWIPDFRSERDYDNQNIQYFEALYRWSEEKEVWVGLSRRVLESLDDGHLTRDSFFDWDEVNEDWIGSMMYEYLYDADQPIVTSTFYLYNPELKEWEIYSHSTYKSEISEENGVTTTFNSRKIDNEWVLGSKLEERHDAFGNVALEELYIYDAMNSSWRIESRTEREALDTALYTLEMSYYWNDEKGELELLSKHVRNFDDQLRITHRSNYRWDAENEKWLGGFRTDVNYGNYLHTDSEFSWNREIDDWKLDSKRFYHYHQEETIAGMNDYAPDKAILFPNPILNGELTIRLEKEKVKEIFIFSASGKILDKISSFQDQSFSFPFHYPNGIYFVKIRTDKGFTTHKVVK